MIPHDFHALFVVPVRPQQRQHRVIPIRQHHVPLRIQLHDHVTLRLPRPEREIDRSILPYLPHVVQSSRLDVHSHLLRKL